MYRNKENELMKPRKPTIIVIEKDCVWYNLYQQNSQRYFWLSRYHVIGPPQFTINKFNKSFIVLYTTSHII